MIAIKDFEMPKSCKECPLTYLDTGDDAYFGANERRCVIDGSCIDGIVSERAYDCPLVEAIPKAYIAEAIDKVEEYICDIETDTVKAQGMAQALDIFEKALGEVEDGND